MLPRHDFSNSILPTGIHIYIFSNSLFVVIGNTRVNHTLTDCSNLEWKFYNS